LINNTNYFAANIEARAGFTLLHERGVSANELHRINNQPRRWARIGAPRYVALALARRRYWRHN
jgi:hypothetical protein